MLRIETIRKHLKKKALSIHQMAELCGVRYATASIYLNELRQHEPIYICRYERTSGDFRPYFKFGYKTDVPKPERIPHSVYDQKRPKRPYKPRNKQDETTTKPRRDLAASWF